MSDDKRTDILNATLKLISEHGFHGTPMSKIAEQAGVGAGTIYRYFANKDALIEELFLKLKHEISLAMLANFNRQASTEEIFRQVWLNTFNYCINNPQEMLFLEQFHNSPFQTAATEAATLEYMAPLIGALQVAIEAGNIKNLPFEMITAFVYDISVAFAKRHISGVWVMDTTNLKIAVQACWDAIKAD